MKAVEVIVNDRPLEEPGANESTVWFSTVAKPVEETGTVAVKLMFPVSPKLPRLSVVCVDFPAMKLDGTAAFAEIVKSGSTLMNTVVVLDNVPLVAVRRIE